MQMEGKRRAGNGCEACWEMKNIFRGGQNNPLPPDDGGGSSYCFSVRKVMDSLKKGSAWNWIFIFFQF